MDSTDTQLLDQHRRGEPGAFAQLVRRHINWVYSAARRKTADAHLAEDITQAVFIVLAQSPPTRLHSAALSPWLFGVLIRTCKTTLRAEAIRRRHESEAAKMRLTTTDPRVDWNNIAPNLEDAVAKLRFADQQAILLRFYQQLSFAEVGAMLGITEEAARKRVSRATEKLRGVLQPGRAGLPATSLSAMLLAEVAKPAPPQLVHLSSASGASGAIATNSVFTSGAVAIMAWTKLNATGVIAVASLLLLTSAAIVILPGSTGRFAAGSVPASTQPDSTVSDWRSRFNEVYWLKDNEALKRIAPPFIPERGAFFDDYVSQVVASGGDVAQHNPYPVMLFRQTDALRLGGVVTGSRPSIARVLNSAFGLQSYEWLGEPTLLGLTLPGDWVIREKADLSELMASLSHILQAEFKRPIRFVLRPIEQEVIVVTGQFKPRPPRHFRPDGYFETIEVYVGPLDLNTIGVRGIRRGPFGDFLKEAGHLIRIKFANRTETPIDADRIEWKEHPSAKSIADMPKGADRAALLAELLDNLHFQTGLTYEVVVQTLPVWFLEESAQ